MPRFNSRRLLVSALSLFVTAALFAGPALLANAQTTNSGVPPSSTNSGVPPSTTNSGVPPTSSGALQNPLNNINSLPELLHAVLQAVTVLGSILLSLMLVYVGFLFVTAQGNSEKLQSARSALVWTLIGGLILLGAQAISIVVQNTVQQLSV